MKNLMFERMKHRLTMYLRRSPIDCFFDSQRYWQDRYRRGGNSGAGSYGRLAIFKAEFVNAFVKNHGIQSVIEFGCGDGAQLELAEYPQYLGVDVSRSAIEQCANIHRARSQYRFVHDSDYDEIAKADLAVSMDVIFHLVEDEAYLKYMERLFKAAREYVVIYSSNYNSDQNHHVKHRRFTDWIERNEPSFHCIETIPNQYPFDAKNPDDTSFSSFFVYQRKPLV